MEVWQQVSGQHCAVVILNKVVFFTTFAVFKMRVNIIILLLESAGISRTVKDKRSAGFLKILRSKNKK